MLIQPACCGAPYTSTLGLSKVRSIYRPHTLIELAMVRSLLAAHDIPYYVHNAGYASLYPGIQIDLLNVPTVMVPPSLAETATELLEAYIPEVVEHLRPSAERSVWHILRLIVEGVFCLWCVPRIGRRGTTPTEP
ncbi:MAG: hypothetical protein A3H27_14955 [Acidobacteria bacterium RIFCSPLOWO2_02_FULL_59_13]|nr:MAG: hypothetical protein A3H27_14955 [Acidobacteria bacterium RIFCSPLOWO2_02_FULL_59_13]